ncbi:hypothetical protein PCANC_27250 [Puccinia coronata f. sp. avenae]|uniref:Uncharacterized protein n=1 Tax=Puccinia coronata f. sp. avenae TaxID=200324 RepID=A0A2N5TIY9_9BASI|nr:hypothetical protein PCANC_27250 [Puccinia coronata f. sp. avenae]
MHNQVKWGPPHCGAHSSTGESTSLLSWDQPNGPVNLLLGLGPAMPAGQNACQASTS